MRVFCVFFRMEPSWLHLLGTFAWVAMLLARLSEIYAIACQNFNAHAVEILRMCLNIIFHYRWIR